MEQVPQINEKTGVSLRYMLAFGSLDNLLRRIEKNEHPRWKNLAKNAFLHRPILRYVEFFSCERYENAVTNRNKQAVDELDRIVGELNMMREGNDLNYERLSILYSKVKMGISGDC